MNNQNKNIMRELKDYFCNFEQMESIVDLGYQPNFVVLRESLDEAAPTHSGILNCQALDFFRDLGYIIQIRANQHGHWYELEKDGITRSQGQWHTYEVSENGLISRLIKLEKEARNGN